MKENMMCPCCMEEHMVQTICVPEHTLFKNVPVEYNAEYYYCDKADERFADEKQMSMNDIAMKNAYRLKMGLLTSGQIAAIRGRYAISQSDFCQLLGWGGKTITRYESHQVQDAAHDAILRKLDSDPEWFLQLLRAEKQSFSPAAYAKYLEAGTRLYGQAQDRYLKSAIMSQYARFLHDPDANGGRELSLDVVVDMIHYYANSTEVTDLFQNKLMRLLWYADAFSCRDRGHSISGLVYRALPTGASPVGQELIVALSDIPCEEINIGNTTGYRYLPTGDTEYSYLEADDREILDAVIRRFGGSSNREIDEAMRQEDEYAGTVEKGIISFRHTQVLNVSG